ncbi:PDZ domain-containing protein [Luteolibacter soli]|uniref:PDZ domain-containing protein n=1 Tax=Luteolibacter soli TaxID=3135280 RepID=A0ABU9ARM0_9BACT
MKFAISILGIALGSFAFAQEAGVEKPATTPPQVLHGVCGMPWLGLTVDPLDDAVRAHVPALPQGIGFVVTDVAAGSPAEKSGVKTYDIFWKLGDQLIANKAQLYTLLRLHKDGDEVKLGLYRSGESLTIPVVLGHPQENQALAQLPIKPVILPDTPMKVLNPAERSATIDTADGKAVLSLVNGQSEVKIADKNGNVLFEGPTKDAQGVSLVPDAWKSRVGALERALAHALKGGNHEQPRDRVLPPPAEQK